MRESATKNSPLPPSVEKAYHQKCIELKRRLREVEETNDTARLRVYRVERAIAKMRIERAILLDTLKKKQEQVARNIGDEDESMPASPRTHAHDHRKHSAPSDPRRGGPTPPIASQHIPYAGHPQYTPAALPNYGNPANAAALAPYTTASARQPSTSHAGLAHSQTPQHHTHTNATTHPLSNTVYQHGATQLPLIHTLPNGTSVMLVAPGTPKPSPWVITELDPRHHTNPDFENLSIEAQEESIFVREYLPFDIHGRPVLLHYDAHKGRYKHVFYEDDAWVNPVDNSIRTDSKERREAMSTKGRILKARGQQVAQGLLAPEEARGGLSPNMRGGGLSPVPLPAQGPSVRALNPEVAHTSHRMPSYREADATPSHVHGHSATPGGRYQQPLAPAPARPSLQPAGSGSHGSQSYDQSNADPSAERAYSHSQGHARHNGSHGQQHYSEADDRRDGEDVKMEQEDGRAAGVHSRQESGGRSGGGGGHGRSTSRTGPPTGGFTAANR